MDTQLKEALKVITDKCKETTHREHREKLKSQKLDKIVWNLKGDFLSFVDTITINYRKTQIYKTSPEDKKYDTRFKEVELTKGEIERAIEALEWFKQDIESCISHLKS